MTDPNTTFVNVILDEECNRLLDASKAKIKRTKRQEAGLRLKDHLQRFGETWEPFSEDKKSST